MSQIIATTLSNGSVSVPTATVVNGSAKAWVNFNGTGTVAIRDSFNVASLTDNGTGSYTINFSSAFSATDYAVPASATKAGGPASASNSIAPSVAEVKATTSYLIEAYNFSAAYIDSPNVHSAVLGDLA